MMAGTAVISILNFKGGNQEFQSKLPLDGLFIDNLYASGVSTI